jgi:hypothetical protein
MWGAPHDHVGRPARPCGAPRTPMSGAGAREAQRELPLDRGLRELPLDRGLREVPQGLWCLARA